MSTKLQRIVFYLEINVQTGFYHYKSMTTFVNLFINHNNQNEKNHSAFFAINCWFVFCIV